MIQAIQSAMKATAPIVAIPIEGHAPVCVRQKLLKGALKGVQITSAELGENRWLIIRGIVQHGRIKTCAKFAPVDRRTAIQELSKWAARESDRHKAKIMLGALDTSQRQSLKRAKYEDDAPGSIAVMCQQKTGKIEKRGLPVEIAEMPDIRFAVVRWGNHEDENISWTVTELATGLTAGDSKSTAEKAILSARARLKAASPEVLAKIRESVRVASDPKLQAAAKRADAEAEIAAIRKWCKPERGERATAEDRARRLEWTRSRKLRGLSRKLLVDYYEADKEIRAISGEYKGRRHTTWKKNRLKATKAKHLIELVAKAIALQSRRESALTRLRELVDAAMWASGEPRKPSDWRAGNILRLSAWDSNQRKENRISMAHRLAAARRTLAEYAEKPEEPKPTAAAPVYPQTVRAVTPMAARPSRWYAGRYVNPAILPPPFDPRRCFTAP